ncbi:hypothetical protein GOP47_0003544 [Adiantum capillus-veneris]|uniref:Pentatricopeptide repeat-containing protein n=1 Tax=Adiantum capillus-veneris TaxID=13818 RepID=A0A9D4ZRY5_ADICA|nr:hypothetical protein GOP47_0003544 [Adiantum capillus-veneris]
MQSARVQLECLEKEIVCRLPAKGGGRSRPASAQQSIHAVLSLLEQGALPQPPLQDLARILHTCKRYQDRPFALHLQTCLQRLGLETHAYLGNYLVPMLVNVGCIENAQQVFDKLVHTNEWSWDSLISGYVNIGQLQHALHLYHRMPKDGSVQPLTHTLVSLLKACAKLKDLESGLQIHADVAKRGLIKIDLFVGSALVVLYFKCGFLVKAQEVFDSLPIKDVVCWTALVAGYAEHGSGQEALYHFKQMQLQNVHPDAVTFVCALKACATMFAEAEGEEIHTELERQGLLESNIIVGNALVDMYAKCGSLRRAKEVFDKLPECNVVSWTALIGGYVEAGCDQEALTCYEQMHRDGVLPNSVTYMSILKSCGSIRALERGRQTHSVIVSDEAMEKDMLVSNALVDMYAKSGALTLAHELFERMEVRNAASWATLILGYTEQGNSEEALGLFERMLIEGVFPDTIAYICGLKCCSNTGAGDKGRGMHAEIERRGLLEGNTLVGNSLVDMYAKCGALALAKEVFRTLTVQDVVSWTALISGYLEDGQFEEALTSFEQMQHVGVSPNVVTYVCALKACSFAKAIDKGQQIHAHIAKYGSFEGDVAIGNILVDVYAKGGFLVTATQVFNRLSVRTAVSWSTLILGYAEHGCGEEAINIFEQMQLEGFFADAGTLVCVLKACCSVGALDKGQEVHAEIERHGLLESELIGNTLITMYANSGLLVRAEQVFDRLPVRDVVTWTALMAGYAQAGDSESVLCVYERMVGEGLMPDPVTFAVILNACSRRGLFNVSQTFFEVMSKDHGITPALDHRICLANVLVRTGKLGEAEAIIRQIPEYSSSAMWNALFNTCKRWGDVKFAEQAFTLAVCSDEDPWLRCFGALCKH